MSPIRYHRVSKWLPSCELLSTGVRYLVWPLRLSTDHLVGTLIALSRDQMCTCGESLTIAFPKWHPTHPNQQHKNRSLKDNHQTVHTFSVHLKTSPPATLASNSGMLTVCCSLLDAIRVLMKLWDAPVSKRQTIRCPLTTPFTRKG